MVLIRRTKSKITSGSLWQYYRDEPALDSNNNSNDFTANNNSYPDIKKK